MASIVGSPSPPAFPESMLSSSLDSSTGSAASSGEVQHGHVASSGEYTSSTTSFVKQREFAEKSGPFLLFNLNLAVLLLSLAFMMSSGAILADRGNATLLVCVAFAEIRPCIVPGCTGPMNATITSTSALFGCPRLFAARFVFMSVQRSSGVLLLGCVNVLCAVHLRCHNHVPGESSLKAA